MFFHLVGFASHEVHSGASRTRNVDTPFFMLWWDLYGFHKNHIRTHYAELVFSHLVGFAGHLLHSGVSGGRNIDALFFMLGWDRYRLHKKRTRTRYVKHVLLHLVGSVGRIVHSDASGHKTSTHYFSCSGGTSTDSRKNLLGHVTMNNCFCMQWDLWVT
jgi:hypothetical protein